MSFNQSAWQFLAARFHKLKQRQYFESAQLNHRWRRHFVEIESNKIYYKSPHHPDVCEKRIWPRWTELLGVPYFWIFLWFIQNNLALLGFTRFKYLVDTPLKRMLLGIEILPPECRWNFAILVFIGASLTILCFAFDAFCPLHRFTFLSIFVCTQHGAIQPKHLALTTSDFGTFSKFRRFVERVYHIVIALSSINLSLTWFILAIAFGKFTINWILSVLNIISAYFWALSVSQALFAISTQAMLVCYYIVLKQRTLLGQIKRTPKRKQYGLAWAMVRRFDRLRGEISSYNRFWCVHITILVNCYAIIITYFVYETLVQKPPGFLLFAYLIYTLDNLICLCLVLQFSRVAHYDRILRKQLVLLLSTPRGKMAPRNCVVTQLMLQNVRSRPTGFTSIDNRLVNSNSYLEIFINMTLVFFLAFKKSKIN